VLGVSFDYHDSAAALLLDGSLVAAAAEERFTRVKHDPGFPESAVAWCLGHEGLVPGDLEAIAFYDKPLATYERILATHAQVGPRGIRALGQSVSSWSRRKLWVAYRIDRAMRRLGPGRPRVLFSEHHVSHAASAFYPSPFDSAAILTFDGAGEWATASIGVGDEGGVRLLKELRFPDSIGLLYSTITAMCGFEVNDGEYKLMGLAPFGDPTFADALRDEVVHVLPDGSVRLNPSMFDFRAGRRMAHPRLHRLLGGPPRDPDAPLGQREADLARSIQVVLEEIVLAVARHAHEVTGERRACLAGGVALNCVANARLLAEGPFEEVWVQPAAGDDGGAIGAACWAWYDVGRRRRTARSGDGMSGCLLGPGYRDDEIATWLSSLGVAFERPSEDELLDSVAEALDQGLLVGWFQGRMEFGPRALGNRSILGDPRPAANVGRINSLVKGREGFRPFAPSVTAEDAAEWFQLDRPAPYMVVTAEVRSDRLRPSTPHGRVGSADDFAGALATDRSEISACTHVDGSARVQTVTPGSNPRFHGLLRRFAERTGCPVLLNTSFNAAGEPIVMTPADALRCFERTGLDVLVLEGCLIRRSVVERAA
jgi:carbamoyltransferase